MHAFIALFLRNVFLIISVVLVVIFYCLSLFRRPLLLIG